MNWDEFKNSVQKEVRQHEAPQDYMELWNKLEPTVDKINHKKKNRGLFFFLSGLGILLLGFGLFYFVNNDRSFVEKKSLIIDNALEKVETKPTKHDEKNTDNKNKEEQINFKEKVNSNDSKELKINTEKNSSKLGLKPKENFIANASNSFENKNQINKPNKKDNPKKQSYPQTINTTSNALTQFLKPTEALQKNALADGKFDENSNESLSFIAENKPSFSTLNGLEFPPIALFDSEQNLNVQIPLTFSEVAAPKKIETHQKFKAKLKLNGYGFFTLKNLDLSNDGGRDWRTVRSNTETALETTQTELLFEINDIGRWHFATGLSWTRSIERLNFTDTETSFQFIAGPKYLAPNLAGGLIEIQGELQEEYETYTHYTRYNTYEYLDIPLLVGYSFPFGKWNLSVEGGPYFNLSLKAKGTILDADESFLNIETDDVFKKSIGVSIGANARIERSIGKHFDVYIGPSIRYFTSSITLESNPVKQKYSLFGASVGVSYGF